jgi:KUP system potassium uptake protein
MTNENSASAPHSSTAGLTLIALGVVYGDIGTSPLYALRETFHHGHGILLDPENILGGMSAIFWALMIIVSLKYVALIMRASNKGEGGIMALLALASSKYPARGRMRALILTLGVLGAALLFGDAVLTPAISVLSAVEGLEIGTQVFHPYVVPVTLVVLAALFGFQRRGTAVIGTFFGPVCLVWFIALAAGGIGNIASNPRVLEAVNPLHALHFVTAHGMKSFLVLGSIFLAVTGAEALYADMGHFGKRPIRIAWYGLVLPALVLNYFGQGALLIADPTAIVNPFYHAYPDWALYPMIGLATAATVIASQATISGAYSLCRQAVQLGYLPRLDVMHTSAREIGQIYLPGLNRILFVAVVVTVLAFESSARLASAYGLAVAGTMLTTTLLTFFVLRHNWGYNLLIAALATALFVCVDMLFFSATLFKIHDGGWYPLLVGAAMFTLMGTWRQGRALLYRQLRQQSVALHTFLDLLYRDPPMRVPGTAVFLTSTLGTVPHALLHNLMHNKVLHERVVFLTVVIEEVPTLPDAERVELEPLGHECYRLTAHYGFMEQPDITRALKICHERGLDCRPMETSFFLSRESIIPSVRQHGMALWRERLFAAMARNAGSAVEYFNLPTNRVIELGTQIEI